MEEKQILVFQDENADYCVIVGTSDRAEAEKALRAQEDEWYGKVEERDPNSDIEKPLSMDEFYAADIYRGIKGSEEGYYWGDKPEDYFNKDTGSEITREDGFVAALN